MTISLPIASCCAYQKLDRPSRRTEHKGAAPSWATSLSSLGHTTVSDCANEKKLILARDFLFRTLDPSEQMETGSLPKRPLFKRRAARTGDGVHRLQQVRLRHQAPEAERGVIQESLCRAPGECASAGNR